jgi:hypothetical protein
MIRADGIGISFGVFRESRLVREIAIGLVEGADSMDMRVWTPRMADDYFFGIIALWTRTTLQIFRSLSTTATLSHEAVFSLSTHIHYHPPRGRYANVHLQ